MRCPRKWGNFSHGPLTVGGGIQHHLDHALDMAIDRRQGANIHTQTTRNARTDGGDAEVLAFNLAGLDNIFGERQQTCLTPRRCTDIGQPPEEKALSPTDFCKRASQRREVVTPLWPVGGLPVVKIITVIHAVIMICFRRTAKPIAVQNAVIDILRVARFYLSLPTPLRNFGDAKPKFSTILKVIQALRIKLHASTGGKPRAAGV